MLIDKEYIKLAKDAFEDKKASCKKCEGECFTCLWDKDVLCLEIRKELFNK